MLQAIIRAVTPEKEFSKRIKSRHAKFWGAPDAEEVRNTPSNADDLITSWKDVNNWQRKLSNKYNSREFAKKFGCKVPELYWKGRNVNDIDFSLLPDCYVIRPTIGHSSKSVFIMKNRYNLFDNETYTHSEIIAALTKRVNENAKVEFLIEEFIKNEAGEYVIPYDYKIYTFKGEVACIGVINRLSPSHGYQNFYDENWIRIKNVTSSYTKFTDTKEGFQAPACLPEMLEQAKTLSKAYEIFVRIDFYASDKGAVFGEFTPTPSMGNNFTSFGEKLLISYWDKYCKNMI